MKIAVFGAGAIGTFFGGRLAQAGHEVSFIARGRTLAALRARGLRIDSPKGDVVIESVRATQDPSEIGPVDLVLITVKTWQVPEVAKAAVPLVGDDTAVLPLQNGVEAADQLASILGARHVLNGMTKVIVRSVDHGHIADIGFDPLIALGELDGSRTDRLTAIQSTLQAGDIAVDLPADIQVSVWEKFLFIAAASGVGAITRAPIGITRSLPETRSLLEQVMTEIYKVGRAKGVALSSAVVDQTMLFVDSLPEESTASMQRDIMEGKPSELESQNGAVVRLGIELAVQVPLNRVIYHALLPMELHARKN